MGDHAVWVLMGAIAVAAWWLLRNAHVVRLRCEAAATVVPPDDALSWGVKPREPVLRFIPEPIPGLGPTPTANVGAPGFAVDAVWDAVPLVEAARQIDPTIIEAVARWRAVDPHDLSGLYQALHDDAGFFATNDVGLLNALHGFVAEQVAAQMLASSHVVDLPTSTTIPGWDLHVDGIPFQIKEGASAYEHAVTAAPRYPEYPFITDPEAATNLHDIGIRAIGLGDLEPAQIAELTDRSLGGIATLAHAGSVHFPILTTLIATQRELRLWRSGRVDGATAVVRAGGDAVAQAMGTALGAQMGVLIGFAAGGPPGAALGALFAAFIGARGARELANRIKSAPLRAAAETYDTVQRVAEAGIGLIARRAQEELEAYVRRRDAALYRELEAIDLEWRRGAEGCVRIVRSDARNIGCALLDWLATLERGLNEGWARYRTEHPSVPWRRILWPSFDDAAVELVERWYLRARETLFNTRAEVDRLLKADDSTEARSLVELAARFTTVHRFRVDSAFAQSIDNGHTRFLATRQQIEERRSNTQRLRDEAVSRAQREVNVRIDDTYARVLHEAEPLLAEVDGALSAMVAEAESLGVTLVRKDRSEAPRGRAMIGSRRRIRWGS